VDLLFVVFIKRSICDGISPSFWSWFFKELALNLCIYDSIVAYKVNIVIR